MKLEYEINRKDFFLFQVYSNFRLKVIQGFYVFIGIFALISLYLSPPDIEYSFTLYTIFFLVFCYGLVFGMTLLLILLITIFFKGKGTLGKHSLEIIDGNLVETTSVNQSSHKMSELHAVKSTKNYLYIFITAFAAHIVPKNEIKDPSLLLDFEKALKETIEHK